MGVMHHLLAGAIALGGAAGAAAGAEDVPIRGESGCLADLAEVEEEHATVRATMSAEDRRDMEILRDAARVFVRVGREDACEDIVGAVEDLLAARQETLVDEGFIAEGDEREQRERLRRAVPIGSLDAPLRAGDVASAVLRNPKGQELGEIEDVVVDPADRTINFLLVDTGSFLGLDDDLVAVPIGLVRITEDRRALVLDIAPERLEHAPRLDPGALAEASNPAWQAESRAFFGPGSGG